MTIQKTENGTEITLKLEGWLDALSAESLGAATAEINSATAIIMDFEQVEYISSAGLRQVVACAKKAKDMEAAFSVIRVGKEVMSIFALTGLDKKLTIQAK